MKLIEIFRGIMRSICFSGIVLAVYSILNGRNLELFAGFLIGFGAYFGWFNFEEIKA